MIVDASAVLAVLFDEADADAFAAALASPAPKRMSVVNYVEAAMRIEGLTGGDARDLDLFLDAAAVTLAPASVAQARAALDAWRRFGKGRHPARLNLGDCFAYALARETGEPLLFKGGDFARTDIGSAL